jgi:transcriptional regulator with XRE-family HTH domain
VATPVPLTLGAKIRQARKEAGYTNVESLAVQLGVGQRTVQRWEADESEPTLARLREVAALTEKPLSFFLALGEAA